jgi:hypothetical protein
MIVNVVDRCHAALLAARPDAGLHADLRLGLSGWRLRLILSLALSWRCGSWRGGVAARTRAFSLNGVHGWQNQHQQKGKTAKRIHRFRVSSTGLRKHATAAGSAPPIRY